MDIPKIMSVPKPDLELLPADLHGLSWWKQIIHIWKNPPLFELKEEWRIELANGLILVFPKHFKTDLASIPRLCWVIISPDGPLAQGAILHDFGYSHGYLLSLYNPDFSYTDADRKLYSVSKVVFGEKWHPAFTGLPQSFFDAFLKAVTISATGATVQANIAWAALRIGGAATWDKYRKHGPNAFGMDTLGLPGVITA